MTTLPKVILLAAAIHSVGGHHRDLIAIFGPVIGAAFIGAVFFFFPRLAEVTIAGMALPWLVLQLGGSPLQLGLVMAFMFGPSAVAVLHYGSRARGDGAGAARGRGRRGGARRREHRAQLVDFSHAYVEDGFYFITPKSARMESMRNAVAGVGMTPASSTSTPELARPADTAAVRNSPETRGSRATTATGRRPAEPPYRLVRGGTEPPLRRAARSPVLLLLRDSNSCSEQRRETLG